MRAADAATIRRGTPSNELMESAAEELCRALEHSYPDWARVVVACGPGNNGGDGLAAARMLAQRGIAVDLFTLGDPSAYRGDPAVNLARARAFGLVPRALASREGLEALRRGLAEADGVVDALFGTGLGRRLEGSARRAVDAINVAGRSVVSADVPSGLSADGGVIAGSAVRASVTVAFGAPKPCHVLAPASDLCGRVVVADIGISRATLEQNARRLWLAEPSDARCLLPARPLESHKADFGRLAIVAGSRGKAGAAVLAARGALRAGAGLVTVFCAESLEDLVVAALPEAMTSGLPELNGALAARAARASCSTPWRVSTPSWSVRASAASAETVRFLGSGPCRGPASRTRRRGRAERVLRARRVVREATLGDGADAAPGRGRPTPVDDLREDPGRPPGSGEGPREEDPRGRDPEGGPHSCRRAVRRDRREPDRLAAARDRRIGGRPLGCRRSAPGRRSRAAGGRGGRRVAAWGGRGSLVPRLGDAGLLAHEVADAVPGVRAALRSRS